MDALFEQLIDYSQIAVFSYRAATGELLEVNESFMEMADLHAKPADVVGRNINDLFKCTCKPGELTPFTSVARQAREVECRFVTTTGRDRLIRLDSFTSNDRDPQKRVVRAVARDISELRKIEDALRGTADELHEKNVALKSILAQITSEKQELRKSLVRNIKKTVMPLIRKLKRGLPRVADRRRIVAIEMAISELSTEFGGVVAGLENLTAAEIEVCNLLRQGMSSRKIAETLGITVRTAETHRNTIRGKLGVRNRHINLVTYLRSIIQPSD